MSGQAKPQIRHKSQYVNKGKVLKCCKAVIQCQLGEINCTLYYEEYKNDVWKIARVICDDGYSVHLRIRRGRLHYIAKQNVHIIFYGNRCIGVFQQIITDSRTYCFRNVHRNEYISKIKNRVLQSVSRRNLESKIRNAIYDSDNVVGIGDNGGKEGIVGFLFPCYESELSIKKIIPNITEIENIIDDSFLLVLVGVENNQYNSKLFNEVRSDFEKYSCWRWSGQTELLIVRFVICPDERVFFDFSRTFTAKIDDLIKEGMFSFFSQIIKMIVENVKKGDSVDNIFSNLEKMYTENFVKRIATNNIRGELGIDTNDIKSMRIKNYIK